MTVVGRVLWQFCVLGALLCSHFASALTHRQYDPVRHDRFTGFPTTPVHNPSFVFDGSRYTGVGWIKTDPGKQVALISPKHIVFAKHYGLAVGNVVRFLNMDNEIIESVIANTAVVPDNNDPESDVIIATLQTAVTPLTGISFFPYYRTVNPLFLRGQPLVVFGHTARAGRGVIDDMDELADGIVEDEDDGEEEDGEGEADDNDHDHDDIHVELNSIPTSGTVAHQKKKKARTFIAQHALAL
jgi:hypothetical protein